MAFAGYLGAFLTFSIIFIRHGNVFFKKNE